MERLNLKFSDIYNWKGKIGRGNYFAWGTILFFIKYNIDRITSLSIKGNSWGIIKYLVDFESHNILMLSDEDQQFYFIMVLTSIPFIWTGLVLTLKRLRSAGLPLTLVILFFFPFVNLLCFVILSMLPEKKEIAEAGKPNFLKRLIPTGKYGNALFAILFTIVFSVSLTLFSIQLLNNYGWGLFIGIPFLLGFSSSLLYGYHKPRTLRECMSITLLTVVLSSLFLLFLAIEGIICLVMAFPIALLLAVFGATIGHAIQSRRNEGKTRTLTSLILVIPLLMSFEYIGKIQTKIYSVTSVVEIDAPVDVVWKNVVEFSRLPEPDELIFRSGVAYPVYAEIEGRGPGAIRKCIFNTGEFIEPIEVWEENHLLQFSVQNQPQPMFEMTPYKNLHTPHLDGYFASTKGQFLLTPQANGKTLLEGTTWYYNKLWPGTYWKIWSDFIIHKIHMRVLKHIEQESIN